MRESPRPFPNAVLALGLLMLLLGGAFLIYFSGRTTSRHSTRTETARKESAEQAGTYRNRAVWSEPAAKGPQPTVRVTRPEIVGNVYDTDGNTLADAVVIATTFELAGNLPSVAATAKSDQVGHFILSVPEGTYQINASLAGYGPTSITVRTGDTASLVLPPSGMITGHVYDEQHQPVRSFSIDVVSVVPGHMPAPAPVWSRSFESADGSYRADQIPAWPVIVRASAKGFASSYSPPITVKPKDNRAIDLTLKVGCLLSGTVEDKSGAPLPYVLVDAESRLTSGSASELSVQTANQMQSEPDSRFRLEHVPFGKVVVRGYDGSHAVSTVTVDVQTCDKLAPVKLVMAAGGGIAGVARQSDGKPLSGARLSLAHRSVGFVATRSEADGSYHFDRIPAGTVRLELHHEGQRTLANVKIKDGEVTKQDMILFTRGQGEIRGRVTANGRPLSGIKMLVAAGHGEKGVDTYYPTTDADGRYRITGLVEGLYLVSVSSTPKGQGVKVTAGGVATLDLDVAPRPEPASNEKDEEEETPPSSTTTAPPAARTPAPPPATTPAPSQSVSPPVK